MSLNTRPYLIILITIILTFIVFALASKAGSGKFISGWGERNQGIMKIILLSVFVLFAAAIVPVAIKLFINLQISIGNGDKAVIKSMTKHAMKLVYTAWIIFFTGLLIALPVMLRNGILTTTK